jgi:hypothetical protein
MKTRMDQRAWTLTALLLAVLALAVTARTVADTPRALAQVARRQGDLTRLHGLLEQQTENRQAVRTYDGTPGAPPDLATWHREHFPHLPAEFSERETLPLRPGWAVRRIDVRLEDARLPEVASMLTEAENLRPPWRMVSLDLTAAPGETGRGRLALVMEALVRPEAKAAP